jgi:hypothetical protein
MQETNGGRALGLFPAVDFRVTTGAAANGAAIAQALWYFRDELIAVPVAPNRAASFSPGVRVDEDLRSWVGALGDTVPRGGAPLVWIAAPDVVGSARLDDESARIATPSGGLGFRLVPKIPLNRSYFDASSTHFFGSRSIKVRGTIERGGIVARTLWPEDFQLVELPPPRALTTELPATLALRKRVRADPQGGARVPFTKETLWQRSGTGGDLRGRAVIGIMLNGAQGDDDEAHGGHFALVTGRVQDDGAIGDWLVNNFYTLDTENEKGIVPAPVPLDNYLADLNAGQAWYRPSCMLVASLSSDRAPLLLQAALGRVYNQFWRHQLAYYHPSCNCTSISIDALRALGWDVPARGGTSRLVAALGFPWFVMQERSVAKAMLTADYLWTEATRLLPAAAFEAIGADLVALATRSRAIDEKGGRLERMLATDLDAILYLQFPQLPSSRAWGDFPVATLREYRQRLPRDPAKRKIVPVPPRPFPDSLRDPDLLPPPVQASEVIVSVWGCLSLAGIPWVARRWWRRRRESRRPPQR